MPGNPLILELVQEILESNRPPEEVCADHPELLWEVRTQLERAQKVEARLAELFPSSIDEPTADHQAHSALGNDLPDIPGYKLEEVIGHGGMGVVFRARHLKLNRLIALKMLLAGAFARPNAGRSNVRGTSPQDAHPGRNDGPCRRLSLPRAHSGLTHRGFLRVERTRSTNTTEWARLNAEKSKLCTNSAQSGFGGFSFPPNPLYCIFLRP